MLSGCGMFDVYRDRQMPDSEPSPPKREVAAPKPVLPELPPLAPLVPPRNEQMPPAWYWSEKQQMETDRQKREQAQFYRENRQAPPMFPNPPVCTSTLLGGSVITTCR